MRMSMHGKAVIVTGGSRGIGKAIVEELHHAGASVLAVSRGAQELNELEKQFSERVATLALDVARSDAPAACLEAIKKLPGRLHGIVCAAGVIGPLGPLEELNPSAWEETFQVNVFAAMRLSQAVLPVLKKQGSGSLVLFSGGGQGPQANRTAYTASKGAIWRFTESLAQEILPFGLRVNAIAPGAVNTRFLDAVIEAGPAKVGESEYQAALKQKAAGGTPPQKAARLAHYLLSDQSIGLSGKVISAVWDNYAEWNNLEKLTASDQFTFRRVVDELGSTRVK